MDKIIIKELEVFANHGVLPAEKELGQKFVITCEIGLDLKDIAKTDNISQTINYADVCKDITRLMQKNTYNLIESCAEELTDHILHNYPTKSVTVTIEKPWAPIGMVCSVSVQIQKSWHKVYLGLGSNMGNPSENLDNAIKALKTHTQLQILKQSSYHQTKPQGGPPQNDYTNCVIEAKTTFSPNQLIKYLLQTETTLGRIRTQHWGPRIIDIDILTYDNIITDDPKVVIPHPYMHTRLFVLAPFCELNPFYVHPLLNTRVQELKAILEKADEKS